MRGKTALLVFLLTSVQSVLSGSIECINGIQTAVATFKFTGEKGGAFTCVGNHHVYSLWAAAKVYCTEDEIEAGSMYLAHICLPRKTPLVPYSTVDPHLTPDYIQSLPVVTFKDVEKKRNWNTSVLLSQELYEIAVRSTTAMDKQYSVQVLYGWALYGFWGAILFLGMLYQCVTAYSISRLTARAVDLEGERTPAWCGPSRLGVAWHWVRQKITIPATFNSYHQRPWFYCTIPTRLESIVVLSYMALNVILLSVTYDTFYPHIRYPQLAQQWQYFANRAANLTLANLPWLWLFGGRNNIFLSLTGWKYSTFSIFHRNIARVVLLLGIIHSTTYTVWKVHDHAYLAVWADNYFQMGAVALSSIGLIVFCSASYFRHHHYEFFLILHNLLALLVIIALFRAGMDIIQLEVIPRRTFRQARPGSYYHIYQPSRWRAWENHPFTTATWVPVGDSPPPKKLQFEKGESQPSTAAELQTFAQSVPSEKRHSNHIEYQIGQTDGSDSQSLDDDNSVKQSNARKLVFWIRPCSGWTKELRDQCLENGGVLPNMKVLIEGPYGKSIPLHAFDNVLYIVGGTGISVAASYLTDHAYRVAKSPHTLLRRRIDLIWASRTVEHIRHVVLDMLAPVLKVQSDIRTSFYATSLAQDADLLPSQLCGLEICQGRPNVNDEIMRYVRSISAEGCRYERTAIVVCGPASMADEARTAMVMVLKTWKMPIEYFEEAYGW
ncbi:uncharacterized protein N7482_008000 [Penicillium canariense]|uniref:FAD-binding FR-type domain-containing protein n=1 Tax=Penicillium canariense TaxID=189055 RepID=A0A9W9HVF4_9EURO|nr:uncharacterized protein N7482_008000 [Penicillium canariense]KAJ5156900.1 hypothetical protein N7482_008000 [Penicillium canariense]